jgi:hypothetical protein
MRFCPAPSAVFLAAALGLAGCIASAGTSQPRDAAEVAQAEAAPAGPELAASENVVCQRERPIGSHIPRMVCRDQQEAIERRERDQEFFMNMSRWGYQRR